MLRYVTNTYFTPNQQVVNKITRNLFLLKVTVQVKREAKIQTCSSYVSNRKSHFSRPQWHRTKGI